MGFKINVNTILRYDIGEELHVGQEYRFEKDELSLLADDIQIWLASKDWTARAEIKVLSQTRKNDMTTGTFVVRHLYQGETQRSMTAIFRRMYGWD
jgi:hypothetical protein